MKGATEPLYTRYMRPCLSVGRSVGWLVTLKYNEKWIFTTRRKEGRGGRTDKEEGATRRKEGRGGRCDEDERARRMKK